MTRARRLSLLVVAGLAAAGIAAGLAFAHGKAAPIGTGVVVIDTNLSYQGAAAAGTGMVLTPSGEVLTNNHVIRGATSIKVVLPKTGRSYAAQVVGYDVTDDVAVIQLQGASNLKTVSVSTARLAVGQAVTALGNAGGTGLLSAARGTITGLGKTITASDDQGGTETLTDLIETDAGVQPGDSGGPLLNRAGKVIGMTTAGSSGFALTSTASDAYAIRIGKAVAIAKQIESGASSSTVHIGATAFLGVQVQSADAYGASGVLVVGVVPGAPADTAGLTAGDVITAVDGRAVSSPTSLQALVLALKPGDAVAVTYTDQTGASGTATVTLGSGPPQ